MDIILISSKIESFVSSDDYLTIELTNEVDYSNSLSKTKNIILKIHTAYLYNRLNEFVLWKQNKNHLLYIRYVLLTPKKNMIQLTRNYFLGNIGDTYVLDIETTDSLIDILIFNIPPTGDGAYVKLLRPIHQRLPSTNIPLMREEEYPENLPEEIDEDDVQSLTREDDDN